ncbi:MAG TPA: hypothetical protein VFH68_10020 [Polyangia bacterium]|jgi:hypothetical protein|nr:hypothetical protein [Polyangia bacterium]
MKVERRAVVAWPAVAWMLSALSALATCSGHLDFGAGSGADVGGGGASCTGDGDCPAFLPHCDVNGSRTCLVCTGDAQCVTAGALRCDPVQHRCVACLAQGDCALGQTCVGGRCATTCREGSTLTCASGMSCHEDICSVCGDDNATVCASRAATPFCLNSWGDCVACRTDLDCGGALSRCDPLTRSCVQCVSSAGCAAPTPYCDPRSGTCAAG